jgi:hypothetical protein
MVMGENMSRRAALALGVGGLATGTALVAAPAAEATVGWTVVTSPRVCQYPDRTTISQFVGAARWANIGGMVHLQFVFRATAVPPASGNPMWAIDAGIGVGGVGDPPAPDIFRPVLSGQTPDPVNPLPGSAVAHKTTSSLWYTRGGHAHLIAGFEPTEPARYVLLGHDRPEPWNQGSSYVNGTEPFAWQVGDIIKGSVAYPPL